MIEIVISRYGEDVSWLNPLGFASTVYDKSEEGNLPNVGFEAQTFLHHFAAQYDSLAEITVCLQGDPFPHLPGPLDGILASLCSESFAFLPIAKHSRWQQRDGSPHHSGLGPANERMWQALTGHCPPDLWHAWYGGQFAVHCDRVRSKPQEFWRHAAALVSSKEEACAVERLWPFLLL